MTLIEYLLQAQNQLRITPFGKISLEAILLHVMQSHFRLPIEQLVRRLSELELLISEKGQGEPAPSPKPLQPPVAASPKPLPPPVAKPAPQQPVAASPTPSVSIDPTPTPADLGKSAKAAKPAPIQAEALPPPAAQKRPQHGYDTLFHFAAVELEGKLQKN